MQLSPLPPRYHSWATVVVADGDTPTDGEVDGLTDGVFIELPVLAAVRVRELDVVIELVTPRVRLLVGEDVGGTQ